MAYIRHKMNNGEKRSFWERKNLQWFTAKKIQMEENWIKICIGKTYNWKASPKYAAALYRYKVERLRS